MNRIVINHSLTFYLNLNQLIDSAIWYQVQKPEHFKMLNSASFPEEKISSIANIHCLSCNL